MKHIKKFNESREDKPISIDPKVRKQQQDVEALNKENKINEWFKTHPFDGVKRIVLSSHYVTIYFDRDFDNRYISISNIKENFYDPKGSKSYKMKEKESISSNFSSNMWKKLIDKKDEFLSWVDKLLIYCDMDRQAIRQLLAVMTEEERYNNW